MKKVLSAVLTAALLVSTVPAAFAASDIDGHWAKSYITELHENGIINPSASTGNYGPDDKVTRWEFMRYINRAFGFTEKAGYQLLGCQFERCFLRNRADCGQAGLYQRCRQQPYGAGGHADP